MPHHLKPATSQLDKLAGLPACRILIADFVGVRVGRQARHLRLAHAALMSFKIPLF